MQLDSLPETKTEFTLANVISDRICDPKEGWISRRIELTEKQKLGFVKILGHGCSQKKKDRLKVFINNLEGQRTRAVHDWIVFQCETEFPESECLCSYVGPGDAIAHTRKIICGW